MIMTERNWPYKLMVPTAPTSPVANPLRPMRRYIGQPLRGYKMDSERSLTIVCGHVPSVCPKKLRARQEGIPGTPANARGSACFVHQALCRLAPIRAGAGAAMEYLSPRSFRGSLLASHSSRV